MRCAQCAACGCAARATAVRASRGNGFDQRPRGSARTAVARAMADGERLALGRHVLQWFDTPHVPHGWDCGLMMDEVTRTFFCGDLFTQPGHGDAPLTEGDVLGPSEAFRKQMDYYAHPPQNAATLLRLAQENPRTLACMHGSAWRGEGGTLLRHLAEALM